MKTLQAGLTFILLSAALLCGANTINEQIEAIQKASPQERVEMMNKLKIELASINKEERANAISALRLGMDGKAINIETSSTFQRIQQIQSGQQGNIIQQNSISNIRQNNIPNIQQNSISNIRQNNIPNIRQNNIPNIQQNSIPNTQFPQGRRY